VREQGYSATNAAFVWPNGGRLAALLVSSVPRLQHEEGTTCASQPARLLELGSGTGMARALSSLSWKPSTGGPEGMVLADSLSLVRA